MGLFDKLECGLTKTTQLLNTDIRDLFKKEGRLIDEEFLDTLFAILVKTDMGVQSAQRAIDKIGAEFRGRVVHLSDVLPAIRGKEK